MKMKATKPHRTLNFSKGFDSSLRKLKNFNGISLSELIEHYVTTNKQYQDDIILIEKMSDIKEVLNVGEIKI